MNDLFSENLRKQVSNGKLSSPSVYFSAGRIYGQALSFEVSEKVPQLKEVQFCPVLTEVSKGRGKTHLLFRYN